MTDDTLKVMNERLFSRSGIIGSDLVTISVDTMISC